ncbi:hypothetical protein Daesc_003682 [Daldinia eschscholtzii]|uniref:Uncharacterized protein n=1 Tax=Daldinia eschscholtzii TaxID=292717 RepID=A0AAX6MM28_9PEZI
MDSRLNAPVLGSCVRFYDIQRAANPRYQFDIQEPLPEFLKRLIDPTLQDNESFEDFSASCDLIKDDRVTGLDIIAEIHATLSKVYSDGDKTIRDADLDSLKKFAGKCKDHLKLPSPRRDEKQEALTQRYARASDSRPLLLISSFEVFPAKVPLEPHIESCSGDRRRCNFGLDPPKAGRRAVLQLHQKDDSF